MRVSYDEMKAEFKRVFLKCGLPEDKAEICARIHTETSRDGVYSHGANRVAKFVDYIKQGFVDPVAVPTKEKEFGAVAVYNGNLGPGITNAFFCADKAIELAQKNGIGFVALNNTTHWMRGGTYGLYIAQKGYVAISWTNTESLMPPWGGTEVKLGNNPFVMAAPGKDAPLLLDMAMSQYSYGKLQVTRLAGKKLPFAGGFDEKGNLTDDPSAIEKTMRMLPIGYWKGASFAFMLGVLAAGLSGGLDSCGVDVNGKGNCGGVSQVFIVIDPSKLTDASKMVETFEATIRHIKSSADDGSGSPIAYPGEGRLNRNKENTEKGILVDDKIWAEIKAL